MTAARITRDLEYKGDCISVSSYFRPAGDDLVVFVHGLGCTKDAFVGAWDSEAFSGYSLLAPDLPGFGASRAPASYSCAMDDYAALLKILVSGFPTRRVHLVAHSMGGAVALLMARDMAISSFANVEGNLIGDDCGMLSRRTSGLSLEAFRRAGFNALYTTASSSSDPGLKKWSEWFAECDQTAFHAASTSLVAWSESGELLDTFIHLKVPKVYIHGDRSANPPVLAAVGSAPRIEIADCGHMIMVEKPDAFFATVGDFLGAASAMGSN